MRVLLLHSAYQSGAASGENRVVIDEARLLSEAGHEVHTWSPTVAANGRLALVAAGARTVWSKEAAAEVAGLLAKHEPDVIHCHNLWPSLSPAVLRSRARGRTPVVMTLHNFRLACLPGTLYRDGRICEDCVGKSPWRGVLHRCYRGSTLGSAAMASSLVVHRNRGSFDEVTFFLAVSEFVRTKHIEAGLAPDRVVVKHNFAWPGARRMGPGEHFLYLGRLAEEKGVATLLDAWRRGVAGKLLIVGDGPERDALERQAPSGVEFRGTVSFEQGADLLARARALLIPSRWYEGQPRSILEAFAAGVPVIASDVGGLPDLVSDGANGAVLPATDPSAWATTLGRMGNDGVVANLGHNARATWERDFTPKVGLKALEDVYARAIEAA